MQSGGRFHCGRALQPSALSVAHAHAPESEDVNVNGTMENADGGAETGG